MSTGKDQELRILILEDVPTDAELVERELRKGGILFSAKRVETKEAFHKELKDFTPDIILSDYMLPHFDGMAALKLVQELAPTIPVIIVTGSMNEEIAVECMKAGAADYVIKNHLARIIPAVQSALENKRVKEGKARLEETLWTSAREWRAAFDAVNNPLALMDFERKIRRCNRAMASLLQKEFKEIIGRNCCEIIHGTIKPIEECPVTRMRETHQRETSALSIRDRWFNIVVDPLLDENGSLIGAIHIMSDITEEKRSEEALRKSENNYRTLVENLPQKIFLKDKNSTYVSCNENYAWDLKIKPEEIFGRTDYDFYPMELAEKYRADDKKIMKSQKTEDIEERYIQNGKETFVHTIKTPVKDEEDNIVGILGIFWDITERKEAEKKIMVLQEQFRQAQKMEAIGRLAGGVAHDFNNLLTIIKGNSQLSLMDLKDGDSLGENLEEIRRASDKASDLIRQLLAFSRRQIMELRVLDLNSALRNLEKMLRRVIGEDIELVTLLSEDLGRVKADPGQIEQVVMNLAVNARDAMASGGRLTIETANADLDEAYALGHVAVEPGRYVMLSVSDTGSGMTREVLERVFEPFFTTKDRDKGTGLGLSTVYGIVKQSGGNIWVYSEPGKGSTFKIYLPQVDEPLEEIKEKAVKAEIPGGAETILITEDSEEVRKLAAKILQRQGYMVLEAAHGDEALSICKQHKGPVHLLITDIVMPRMSGRELAARVAEIQPGIKILYMSGYTDNAVVHHGILDRETHYIQKPFTLEGMAQKVREVLDE